MLKKIDFIYRCSLNFPKLTLFICLILSALSIWGSAFLTIENRLSSFLPQKLPTVQNMETYKTHFGGLGFLGIVLEGKDPERLNRFGRKLAQKIAEDPHVRNVDFELPLDFFKKREWLYLETADLAEIERRIDRSLELEKKGVSASFGALVDFADPEDNPDLSFEDLLKKYRLRAQKLGLKNPEDNANFEQMVVLKVKAREHSEDLDQSRDLNRAVRAIVASAQKEDPDFSTITVEYMGGYQTGLEEYDQIRREMGFVSVGVAFVLALIFLIYFRRIKSIFWVGIPLGIGILWTGGLTFLALGHLNMITAFAASILGGLGSDYGIYLLTRYQHERARGSSLVDAVHLAFSSEGTGRATYASMATTVGAFLALVFSDFRLFFEMGCVGAIGLVSTYLAMLSVLPALLSLTDRSFKQTAGLVEAQPLKRSDLERSRKIADLFTLKAPKTILLCFLIGIGLFSSSALQNATIEFQEGQIDTQNLPANKLLDRVRKTLNTPFEPSPILTLGVENEQRLINRLRDFLSTSETQNSESANAGFVFNEVLALDDLVPKDQTEKRQRLARIREKISQTERLLQSKKQKMLESLDQTLATDPVTREKIPAELGRMFLPIDASGFSLVYLFPSFARNETQNMQRYADGIQTTEKEIGEGLAIVDPSLIAYDTLRLIRAEAPSGLGFTVCALVIFLAVIFRPLLAGAVLVFHLLAGLWLSLAILGLLNIPLNIMNIIVFPIILGTGIDCFIHYYHRFHELKDLRETSRTYFSAIAVSNLTTIVGFGGLLFTSNVGLRSIGWVAVIGLSVITLICGLIFPRALKLFSSNLNPS